MTAAPPEADAGKEEWRAWARAARTSIDWIETSEAVRTALLEWEQLPAGAAVLIYMPMADEINLQPLLESGRGCRWLTTRTPPTGRTLTIHELGGPLEVHRFGYLQPHASAPEVHPFDVDVMLVPGLTFDLWGNRLGHGAGFYDRLLAMARSSTPLVGVVPAALVVDALPTEPHDVAMTHLATEEGVIEVAGASAFPGGTGGGAAPGGPGLGDST